MMSVEHGPFELHRDIIICSFLVKTEEQRREKRNNEVGFLFIEKERRRMVSLLFSRPSSPGQSEGLGSISSRTGTWFCMKEEIN